MPGYLSEAATKFTLGCPIFALLALGTVSAAELPRRVVTQFSIDSDVPVIGLEMKADKGKPLLTLSIHAPVAIRLDEDVQIADPKRYSMNEEYSLKKGQILTGFGEWPGIFCMPLRVQGLGLAAPCLMDRDGDHKFEAIGEGQFNSGKPQALAITNKSKVVFTTFTDETPMSAKVAYSEVDPALGPKAPVLLRWKSRPHKTNPELLLVEIWLATKFNYTGTNGSTRPVRFLYDGQSHKVEISGVILRLSKIDSAGAIHFTVDALPPTYGMS